MVVLRTDSRTLFDRLTARGYAHEKVQENLDVELMDVLIEEARDAFAPEMVVELASATEEELEGNVARIAAWVEQWQRDNEGREDESESEDENEESEDEEEEVRVRQNGKDRQSKRA